MCKFVGKFTIASGENEKTFDFAAEFDHNPDTYGNGYYMNIVSPNEPWGCQSYDIRYDQSFSKNSKLSYVIQFFSNKYDGQNGAWKLRGIEIHESQ